ncbi:hypothetical protein MMC25_001966 [Agyrium rufum]|nr:hypothetical protein [Agyrium rufum]
MINHPPLLTSHDASGHVHLVIGSNSLASARCSRSLDVGAQPIVLTPPGTDLHYGLQKKIEDGSVKLIKQNFDDADLTSMGRAEVDHVVDAVFVTLSSKNPICAQISKLCRRLRIPVNMVDSPNLCTFSLLTTHSDGPLQIGITTSGKGCKLASRIKREIASVLPPNLGQGVERLGTIRRRIWEEDHRSYEALDSSVLASDDEGSAQKSNFNQLVTETGHDAAKTRRMRWLSQICEYWPLRRLAAISEDDISSILQSYTSLQPHLSQELSPLNRDSSQGTSLPSKKPLIILAGSGPGSPDLLTIATHRAIKAATFILADKLVPAPVLDLIPRRTPVHIARKFPGNAEAAQEELLSLGLNALKQGHTVLRLKQGDPYIYGRGGEEYLYFRDHGFEPMVLPGITSSLSAPMFAQIPATQRGATDQVLICTGTGRKGAAPKPPPYVKTQTVVFLMALHRLEDLIRSMIGPASSTKDGQIEQTLLTGTDHWPAETPCAVIERASCPDQRVIRSTLRDIVAAIEEEGSRPPGLLAVGWSCEVLRGREGSRWMVEDGFAGFSELLPQADLRLLDSQLEEPQTEAAA